MSERTQRRTSRLLAGILTLAAAYYALRGGAYDLFDLRDLRREHAATAARIDSLRAGTDSLRARAAALADDPLVIERVARERFGFIRPGERLFRFVDPRELEPATGAERRRSAGGAGG